MADSNFDSEFKLALFDWFNEGTMVLLYEAKLNQRLCLIDQLKTEAIRGQWVRQLGSVYKDKCINHLLQKN